jgi:hydroxymethylbilane synthase
VNGREFIVGTRGSELALWQARHTQALLGRRSPHVRVRLETIKTRGDREQEHALYKVEDKGFFTKEIEEALRSRRIDIAVHSLKDLPTESPAGLVIAAVPEREDAHDVWVARSGGGPLEAPPGARVGTSSLRRQAQLRALRPDLRFEDLRGNVPTRLRRLDEARFDAVVLARAGLARLELLPEATFELPFELMLPAPAQGALGIQVRSEDEEALRLVFELNDPATRLAVTAERAFLSRLQGGCLVPVGAHASPEADGLHLSGMVADLSGDPLLRGRRAAPATNVTEAETLGFALADDLLVQGAGPVLDRVREFFRRARTPDGPRAD